MPYVSYKEEIKSLLLNGSGNEKIQFYYPGRGGKRISRKHPFEGVIPNLKRRYKETESQRVKDALSKFMSTKPCALCEGSRLNETARNVLVKNYNKHCVLNRSKIIFLGLFLMKIWLKKCSKIIIYPKKWQNSCRMTRSTKSIA